jgi:hypothetical protein
MTDAPMREGGCRRAGPAYEPAAPRKGLHAGMVRALGVAASALLVGLVAAQPVQAAELRRIKIGLPDIEVFHYQGPVAAGDALRLQTELARIDPRKRVAILLSSPGGLSSEGKALGRLFYNAKISTFVRGGNGGVCMSACAMAFLGGRDSHTGEPLRVVIQGGALGFHQFWYPQIRPEQKFSKAAIEASVAQVQKEVFDDLKYLKEIRQDPRTYRRIISAPAESMMIIRDSDALQNGFHVLNAEMRSIISPNALLDRMNPK